MTEHEVPMMDKIVARTKKRNTLTQRQDQPITLWKM